MKTISICDFSDVLFYAEKMGFFWNQAHELLVNAELYIGHITNEDYLDGYNFMGNEHTEARNIIKSFMEHHKIEEFYITPKNHELQL